LDILPIKAAPAAREITKAVEIIQTMYAKHMRKVPNDAPTGFIRKRWEKLIFAQEGIDRCFYELCTLSEVKNALRSGDI